MPKGKRLSKGKQLQEVIRQTIVSEACLSGIEPGSPWENGYCESFNGKMRDEFLNMERFDNWFEVTALIIIPERSD